MQKTAIRNVEGARTTPSVVAFLDNEEKLVGQPAKSKQTTGRYFCCKEVYGRKWIVPLFRKIY